MDEQQGSPQVIADTSADDHIVLAQAQTGTPAQSGADAATDAGAPRELVPQGALQPTAGPSDAGEEADILAGAGLQAASPAEGASLTIPPDAAVPASGERIVVEVEPGTDVRLVDPTFSPDEATYSAQGDDLVVTTAANGTLVLDGFYAAGATPTTLSLLDGSSFAAIAGEGPAGAAVTSSEQIAIPPDFAVPLQGERVVVQVEPGADVALRDPAFDPRVAEYAVDGDDLMVTLNNGGMLILEDFFAAGAVPSTLTLLDGPAVLASDLLQQAETFVAAQNQADQVEPAAGEGQGANTGGGAEFRPYAPGNIGPGLDPLGPLGPTALAFDVNFNTEEVIPILSDAGDDDGGVSPPPVSPPPVSPPPVSPPPVSPPPVSPPPVSPPPVSPPPVSPPPVSPPPPPPVSPPPPPVTEPPEITLRNDIKAIIGEQNIGFNPACTPTLPSLVDGQRVPDDQINGIDQNILTLDQNREVFVRFVDETSISIDSLFVHEIAADGSIVNIKAVFPFTNKPGEPFEPADLEPGTEVSIGRYDAGTQINFFVVNDGGRQNDPSVFEGGRFEARNPRTGEIAKITDFGGDTQIVHIAEDGTETILKARALYGADASQQTTNNNRLNFDGEGHVVSGWDDATGSLVFGFEDSYRANKDNDFNDDVYAVRFGSVTERFAFLVGEDAAAGLGASITDPDSARMEYARVVLKEGFDGDVLTLPDQILLGTNIKLHFQTDGDLRFSGVDSIANYEKVISSIGLEVDGESVAAGDRVITAMVRDTEGNPSNTARTVVDLTDRLIAGDDGDNVLIGNSRHNQEDVAAGDDTMAGRGGNDHLNGQSGNDFLDGGEGRDLLEGKLGNDILNGGAGQDVLVGGKGADEFRYTGLSDGTDLIRDFNANEGDVLGLGILFRDTDLDLSKIDQFVRLEARALDSDERANDLAVQVDLDGGAADGCHRFVTIFEMQNPTGVNADTDVLSILTLQQNVQPS